MVYDMVGAEGQWQIRECPYVGKKFISILRERHGGQAALKNFPQDQSRSGVEGEECSSVDVAKYVSTRALKIDMEEAMGIDE